VRLMQLRRCRSPLAGESLLGDDAFDAAVSSPTFARFIHVERRGAWRIHSGRAKYAGAGVAAGGFDMCEVGEKWAKTMNLSQALRGGRRFPRSHSTPFAADPAVALVRTMSARPASGRVSGGAARASGARHRHAASASNRRQPGPAADAEDVTGLVRAAREIARAHNQRPRRSSKTNEPALASAPPPRPRRGTDQLDPIAWCAIRWRLWTPARTAGRRVRNEAF
jgi:hypothetical protein